MANDAPPSTNVANVLTSTVTARGAGGEADRSSSNRPLVSIVVVAHRAAGHIHDCLESLRNQDFPREKREFVLVHSAANDGTHEAFQAWRDGLGKGERVVILANPKVLLAAGWNVALAAAKGDVILRIDAHARALPGYLARSVELIASGRESIVGGQAPVEEPQGWEAYLCWLVSRSLFGAGQAAYRRRTEPGFVDTLAYAAYHRRVFDRVGGYDERLGRTEDNEMHYRMKQAGFRFYFDPTIASVQMARPTIRAMLRQKFLNGYWVSLTLAVAPRCFSPRHFIPGVFVAAILISLVFLMRGIYWPLMALGSTYSAGAILAALFDGLSLRTVKSLLLMPLLPPAFLALHLANGFGLLWGLVCIPSKLASWRGYCIPHPTLSIERP